MLRLADGHENIEFREYKIDRESDLRLMPRIGHKPVPPEELVKQALIRLGRWATLDEIAAEVCCVRPTPGPS
jgi:hypothetical protein